MDFEITPEEVNELRRHDEDFVLLDVREPHEIAAANLEGSLTIPMGEIPARLQELDPEQHIVVMCHHGVRSANVAAWLQRQGFERVQSMRGGIDRWAREVDPRVPVY